jgi:hypothetical protein
VCQRRVEVHSLGWCKLGSKELGTWIFVRARNPMRAWVLTSLGSQVHSGTVLVDSYTLLGGDTVVEIWSSDVYSWVERPWSATSWCHLS